MHGGNDKAVYVYPGGHYPHWLAELGAEKMGSRSFGENWLVRGVTESNVHIGDIWEVGEAKLEVSKVRTPCRTLLEYYQDKSMIKRMARNGRCGWYLRVLQPGIVPTSGTIQVTSHNLNGPTVAEAFAAKMRGVRA